MSNLNILEEDSWVEYIDVTKCSSNPRCKLNSRLKCPLKGVKNLLAAPRLVLARPPVCCLTFPSQWWCRGRAEGWGVLLSLSHKLSIQCWLWKSYWQWQHSRTEQWRAGRILLSPWGLRQCESVSVTWYDRLYAGKDWGGMLRSHHLILITDNFNVSTGCQIKWIRFLILHICPDIYSGTR